MKVWPKFFDVVFLPPHQLPHVPGQPGFVAQPPDQPIHAGLRAVALVPNLQDISDYFFADWDGGNWDDGERGGWLGRSNCSTWHRR